jgi:hypothetical protein
MLRLAAVSLVEYAGCSAMPFLSQHRSIHELSLAGVASASAFLVVFAAPRSLANCAVAGCASGTTSTYTQPAFTPTLGQEMLLEARKAAASAWQPELLSPRPPVIVGVSMPVAATGAASPAPSNAMRSWTNGEGQWMSSPTGAACQVSSRGSLASISPCTDGF